MKRDEKINNQPESAGGKRKVFYLVSFLKIIVDGKNQIINWPTLPILALAWSKIWSQALSRHQPFLEVGATELHELNC